MLRFMVQALQDPPICSSTDLTSLVIRQTTLGDEINIWFMTWEMSACAGQPVLVHRESQVVQQPPHLSQGILHQVLVEQKVHLRPIAQPVGDEFVPAHQTYFQAKGIKKGRILWCWKCFTQKLMKKYKK